MKTRQATSLAVALIVMCLVTVSKGQGCESEIILLLDGSSTLGLVNFNEMKIDVETFINNTFLNYPNTRIGLIVFSTNIETQIGLRSSSALNDLLSTIRNANYPNGARNTHLAIDQAVALMLSDRRAGSPMELILATVGLATNGTLVRSAAIDAQNEGISIFALRSEIDLVANPVELAAYRQELSEIARRGVRVVPDFSFSFGLGDVAILICRVLIVTGVNSDVKFTTETIILNTTLNQAGIVNGLWLKDGVVLTDNPRFSFTREDKIQRLIIANAQVSDTGNYTFIVGGESSTGSVTVVAGVFAYPRRVTNYLGQTVTLNVVLVNPVCSQGQWLYNLGTVNFFGRFSYIISSDCRTHTLQITNAQLSDEGTYQFLFNSQIVQTTLTITATATPINGGFGDWTLWTSFQCPVTCGASVNRTITRSRQCDNPFPQNGGANCSGVFQQFGTISCGFIGCPVNGGLSQWSEWNFATAPCSQTCGTNAVKTTERRRTCTSPRPRNGGRFCLEALFERRTELCNLTNPCLTAVNGGTSLWSLWTIPSCNVTCGVNATRVIVRSRTCTNPAPSSGGVDCQEALVDQRTINCGLNGCPVNGGLSEWGAWSNATAECPATCGISVTRTIQRIRQCNNPTPQYGGDDCTGTRVQTASANCSLSACPGGINGGVGQWSSWSVATTDCPVTCGAIALKNVSRIRYCNNPPPSNGGRDCLDHLIEYTRRPCNLDDCPVNGGYSEWEAWDIAGAFCPFTCGVSVNKTVERIRRCNNPPPSNGGANCVGPQIQNTTVSCNLSACPVPVNGGVSLWGEWDEGPCTATCGAAIRNITRTRTCTNPRPSNGGIDCVEVLSQTDTKSCGFLGCDVDGGVGSWGDWSTPECSSSITCGEGVTGRSVRTRLCDNPRPAFNGDPCFEPLSQEFYFSCNLSACPVPQDGGVSQWTQWSVVNCPATCGRSETAVVTRQRSCNNPFPSNGGRSCEEIGFFLAQNRTDSCGLDGCPVDGGISEWGEWDIPNCLATCGVSEVRTIRRRRTCTAPTPEFGGANCTETREETNERSCELPECQVPVDGGFSQWSPWSTPQCGSGCGDIFVVIYRTRECNNPVPRNEGQPCSGDRLQAQRVDCGFDPCPIDGGLSAWSSWIISPCDRTCGVDVTRTARRVRTCTNPVPQFNGKNCSGLGATVQSENRTCNVGFCPIDGGFTEWTPWNFPSCLFTCGSTLTRNVTRRRSCTEPIPQFGGRNCFGDDFESYSQNCGLPSCAVDGGISFWTQWVEPLCIFSCGVDRFYIAYRQRFCSNPPPRDGGRNCTESRWDTDVRNCRLPNCPVDGGVSQWSQWSLSGCTTSCGFFSTGLATRERFCNNPFPAYNGRNCTASLNQQEVRRCGLPPCPINGGLSFWTGWSIPACSRSCGSEVTRRVTRVRFCNNPYPQYNGLNCTGSLYEEEDRNCGLPRCTVDGGFGLWSQWSLDACIQTCGISYTTQATRFRTCSDPVPTDGGRNCTGEFRQTTTRGCNLNQCPVNGGLTFWTEWSVPNCFRTCGPELIVTVHRLRTCTNPIPRHGGLNCTGSRDETEPRSCNISPCPVNGGLTQWSGWFSTECSSTCGTTAFRRVSRNRTCTNPSPANGGSGCAGSLFESETRLCGYTFCPIDGGISQWSVWSDLPCTITCGPTAVKVVTRTRVCNSPLPAYGGRHCNDSSFEYDVRNCGLGNCPVDGVFTLWTSWTDPACPVSCGFNPTKNVTRFRTCTNPAPQFGGRNCTGQLTQTTVVLCDVPACPVDGGLSQWSPWSDPFCEVTCGTAATKEVVRTRSCTSPVPLNGGAECTGNRREVEIRSCNLAPCPVLIPGLCQSAQIVSGVGYRYHPTDCDKYIQCYYNLNGYVIGVYRSCPFGYYWDQRTLRCDHPWKVDCPLEKCVGDCVANYNLEGSCRSHWVCNKGVSNADCCPMGFRYVVGQGCRPDFYCRDTCPTPCASRDVCDKRPDWNDNPRTYNISVGLLGWIGSSCSIGTYFDLLDCGCSIPSDETCSPDYFIDFSNSNDLIVARDAWLSMTDVSTLNGYARFNGIGHMFINISQKAPAPDCPLIVRFRFAEAQTVTSRRILASTSDCYRSNTLVIAIEEDSLVFEIRSVFGQTFRMALSLAGFRNFEWKTVTMVYDGEMLGGVVESSNLKYMQRQNAPMISLMECGMRFGSDGSMSSAERFIGAFDSFAIYRCNPGGVY